jgi:radical SAM protein with 4Fe4S-binding SPASM domain
MFLPVVIREKLHTVYKKLECREHHLSYLFLELTRSCNLTCRHCGSDCSSNESAVSLTTDSWLKILDSIAEQFNPLPFLVLTGGEATIHPDFKLIIEKISTLGFKWGLVSNGYSIDQSLVNLFDTNNISSITISLDGTQEIHNWLRCKPDSFQNVLSTLDLLSKSKCAIKDVVTCVHRKNIDDLDNIAQILIDKKIGLWRLFRIFPSGRAKDNEELTMSDQETRRMLDWIASNKKSLLKRGLDCNFSCEGFLPFALDSKVRNAPFFCRAGINMASILCDGTITGCSNNAPQFHVGNIQKDNLGYLWQHSFTQFRDKSWVRKTSCQSCRHINQCEGGSIHLWRNSMVKPDFCYKDCFK